MQVGSATTYAVLGMQRAERSFDQAAQAVFAASAPSDLASGPVASLGPSDPLDGVETGGGDLVGAMVQVVASQRAFEASLAVMKTADAMTRSLVDMVR